MAKEKATKAVKVTHTIMVMMRDLVSSQGAMTALSVRPLTGGVAIKVARALRKARNAVNDYKEAELAILKKHGAVPSKMGGFELDKKAPSYEAAWKEVDKHQQGALGVEIELTGVQTIKLDKLLDAIPHPEFECPKCERKMDLLNSEHEEKAIEPFILAELDWLIIE